MKKENMRIAYNRTIVLLLLAVFASSWVMINAGEFITSALLYLIIAVISPILYLIWDKF